VNSLSQISPPAFVHNLDTCVGCHACVIACANENGLSPGRFWRQIVSYNSSHVPDLPVYHLSLACNHCLDAPCVKGCPASAIERDGQTGAVLINDLKCIGCRYCGWVCPFDAPQFDSKRGVMEKCTFCNHRLLQNEQPACTSMCPTGALSLGKYCEPPYVSADGFPDTLIRPAITFIPLKGRTPQPAPPGAVIPGESEVAAWVLHDGANIPESKISPKTEWPLAVFSFIGIALVAWFLSALAGGLRLVPELFGLLGAAGIGLSIMHLGRKERMWRAILNWRRSWLSREVVAYSLFIGLGLVSAVFFPGGALAAWLTAGVGVFLLIAIDSVYTVMARDWSAQLDGQASVLSAAFLVSISLGNASMAIVLGLLRLYALMDRIQRRKAEGGMRGWSDLLSISRAVVGFVGPAVFWMSTGVVSPLVILLALLGEFADRLDFYSSLDVTTPRRTMGRALAKNIFSISSSAGR
jgi:Fe-S-cluster-containing dehydrogenase component